MQKNASIKISQPGTDLKYSMGHFVSAPDFNPNDFPLNDFSQIIFPFSLPVSRKVKTIGPGVLLKQHSYL